MRARFWIVLGVLGLAGIGGLMWLATSTLFLRTLLPPSAGQYEAFIASVSETTLVPFESRIRELFMSDGAQKITDNISRWAYRKDGDANEAIAAHVFNKEGDITQPQWHVQDFGVTSLFSTNQLVNPYLSRQTLQNVLRFVIDSALGRLPFIQPSIVIDVPGQPGPIAVVGKVKDKQFTFVYSQEESLDELQPQPIARPDSLYDMYIALPSEVLQMVPVDVQEELQKVIEAELGLTKARPNILDALEQSQAFALVEGEFEGEAALGVIEGGASFTEATETWVALERGYLEPSQRAFRLPDGTVGFEYIPSQETGDGFSEVGLDKCSISYIGSRPLWLCRDGNIAVLSTAAELGYRGMDALRLLRSNENWQVSLPDPYASKLIQGLLSTGQSEMGQAHVNHVWIEGENGRGGGVVTFE